jgi:hypothetical protein
MSAAAVVAPLRSRLRIIAAPRPPRPLPPHARYPRRAAQPISSACCLLFDEDVLLISPCPVSRYPVRPSVHILRPPRTLSFRSSGGFTGYYFLLLLLPLPSPAAPAPRFVSSVSFACYPSRVLIQRCTFSVSSFFLFFFRARVRCTYACSSRFWLCRWIFVRRWKELRCRTRP